MFNIFTATMKTVRILNNSRLPYTTNQVVQFSDAEADALILSGTAALYSPGAYTPYIPPAAGKSPVTNIGIGGGGNIIIDSQQNAAIQALETKLNNLDPDGDGRVNAENQQSLIRPQTIVSDTWTINHNLNRHPPVLVRNSAGEPVTPNEVQYPTPNTMIITFGVPMSGTAEFI